MSMDDVALRDLAESMGMKKNSTDNKEEMAYFVIDNASAQVAREEAARLKPRAQKERKPRTKRVSAAVTPESQEGDAATDVSLMRRRPSSLQQKKTGPTFPKATRSPQATLLRKAHPNGAQERPNLPLKRKLRRPCHLPRQRHVTIFQKTSR